jgi:hypothetical protein
MTYVDLTPRWTEILPTWLMMYRQSITGDCANPELIRKNATDEFRRMAEAADKFNDLVAFLTSSQGNFDAEYIKNAIELGRNIAAAKCEVEHDESDVRDLDLPPVR